MFICSRLHQALSKTAPTAKTATGVIMRRGETERGGERGWRRVASQTTTADVGTLSRLEALEQLSTKTVQAKQRAHSQSRYFARC